MVRPRRFVEDPLARVRDLLVLTLGGERAESVLSDDARPRTWTICVVRLPLWDCLRLRRWLIRSMPRLANMTGAISPRMRLELALPPALLAGREGRMTRRRVIFRHTGSCRRCRAVPNRCVIHGRLPSPRNRHDMPQEPSRILRLADTVFAACGSRPAGANPASVGSSEPVASAESSRAMSAPRTIQCRSFRSHPVRNSNPRPSSPLTDDRTPTRSGTRSLPAA